MKATFGCLFVALSSVACSEAVDPHPGGTGGGGGTDITESGKPLAVPVPEEGRVFVTLDPLAIAPPTSTDWDLAFEGFDVFTNSGPSGPGAGGAFGPLSAPTFLADQIPEVPFLQHDATGGAFLGWYLYDGTAHALYSRYHVYGVREGSHLWKVQLLSYYSEAQGAPVSALYQLRYAEVSSGSTSATQTLVAIDGTAGGLSGPVDSPSGCLDLGSGKVVQLSPDVAQGSNAWHLCFRRDKVSVNGGLSGSRGVIAVDLDGHQTATEASAEVMKRTAESEADRFTKATYAALTAPTLAYHGDRIVSAFSDHWIDPSARPAAPALATWLVLAADGEKNNLVAFEGFTKPTAKSPGTVKLRSKVVE